MSDPLQSVASNPLQDPSFVTTPPPNFSSPFDDNPFASDATGPSSGAGSAPGGGAAGTTHSSTTASTIIGGGGGSYGDSFGAGIGSGGFEANGSSRHDTAEDEDGNDSNVNGSTADDGAMQNGSSTSSVEVKIDERLNPYAAKPTRPCCETDRRLRTVSVEVFNPLLTSESLDQQGKAAITIAEAQKCSEGSGSFIAYIIRTDIPSIGLHLESKHRYSDFESLNRLFRKVHPTIVVPPIPDKHSVADYAARPGKAKDDPKIIETRKKTLQSFLNRVAAHPVLGREHVLHRFLDGAGGNWTEILMDSGLAHYLKKKDPLAGIKLTDSLLKNPDQHFLASEDYTYRFGVQLANITKFHRRIVKHHAEIALAGSDLGASYNGWSLTETGPSAKIAHAIEAVGEAVDTTVSATSQLVQHLEDHVSNPMAEYEKLTKSIETILRWRHSRHVNYEGVTEQLVTRRVTLAKLESSEQESQRLSAVLSAEGTSGPATARMAAQAQAAAAAHSGGTAGENGFSGVTVSSGLGTTGRSQSGSGLLATLNSFMDNDPEATRRANITKNRDRIASLEQERKQGLAELGAANEAIQRDLDRFQRDKVHDLRNMLLAYAVAQRDMCKKSLKAWEESREQILSVDITRN